MAKPILMIRHPDPKEPTPAQAAAGNYAKRKLDWNGLKISIENEAGSIRRGVDPGGHAWQSRIHYAYGYVRGTEGVDGDEVDVYVGPHLEAAMVYVIHQRKYGDWAAYDEDKAMLGFLSESDAVSAYLSCYDDSRFLGPVTAMTLAEFSAKVRKTKGNPSMIKALLLIKSYVGPYLRSGRMVGGYQTARTMHVTPHAHQGNLFPDHPATGAREMPHEAMDAPSKKYYVTVIREAGKAGQKVGWLAGPFDTNDEALTHVAAARKAASAADPFTDFDAFGTSMREAKSHPPGRLNSHLGL